MEKKRRRTIAKKACQECREKHAACENQRPCSRCKSLGLECVDVLSRKRGRKRKNGLHHSSTSSLPSLDGSSPISSFSYSPTSASVPTPIMVPESSDMLEENDENQIREAASLDNSNTHLHSENADSLTPLPGSAFSLTSLPGPPSQPPPGPYQPMLFPSVNLIGYHPPPQNHPQAHRQIFTSVPTMTNPIIPYSYSYSMNVPLPSLPQNPHLTNHYPQMSHSHNPYNPQHHPSIRNPYLQRPGLAPLYPPTSVQQRPPIVTQPNPPPMRPREIRLSEKGSHSGEVEEEVEEVEE